jgi:hypothetical protein
VGSVRTQPTSASAARTVPRPATKPGYPPQLDAPNSRPPRVRGRLLRSRTRASSGR